MYKTAQLSPNSRAHMEARYNYLKRLGSPYGGIEDSIARPTGAILGGLAGAALGGGLAAFGGGTPDMSTDEAIASVGKKALIGALLGGGAGAYGGYKLGDYVGHDMDLADRDLRALYMRAKADRAQRERQYARTGPMDASGPGVYANKYSVAAEDILNKYADSVSEYSLSPEAHARLAPVNSIAGPLLGGVVGAGAGAIAGALGTMATGDNMFSTMVSTELKRNALIGALLGGTGGAYLGHLQANLVNDLHGGPLMSRVTKDASIAEDILNKYAANTRAEIKKKAADLAYDMLLKQAAAEEVGSGLGNAFDNILDSDIVKSLSEKLGPNGREILSTAAKGALAGAGAGGIASMFDDKTSLWHGLSRGALYGGGGGALYGGLNAAQKHYAALTDYIRLTKEADVEYDMAQLPAARKLDR